MGFNFGGGVAIPLLILFIVLLILALAVYGLRIYFCRWSPPDCSEDFNKGRKGRGRYSKWGYPKGGWYWWGPKGKPYAPSYYDLCDLYGWNNRLCRSLLKS
jgi:hypothetical protein